MITARPLLCASALALTTVSAWTPSARAEPAPVTRPTTKKHARELFAQGVALTKENRWRDALAAFEESSRLYPHARTTFNIGYCERGLGRFTRARARFREALAMDAATPDKAELNTEVRDAAKRYLKEAEQRIGRVLVVLPEGATSLSFDGRPLTPGKGPHQAVAGLREPGPPEPAWAQTLDVDVDEGKHVMLVVVDDGRRLQLEVQVVGGSTVNVRPELPALPLSPPPPNPAPRADAPVLSPRTHDDGPQIIGAGVLAAIGLGGVVTGSILLSRALNLHEEAADACPNTPFCPDDRAFDLANDAQRHGNLATAAFVVGGAGLGCASFLLLTAPSLGLFDDDVAVVPSLRGLMLRGVF